MSVINLFDMGQTVHNPNQVLLQRYMSMKNAQENTTFLTDQRVNTVELTEASSIQRQTTMSAKEQLELLEQHDLS